MSQRVRAPRFSLVSESLAARAKARPLAEAFRFCPRGDVFDATVITYAELDQRARQIAAELVRRAPNQTRHVLLLTPGVDFVAAFYGCLYAARCAVPVPLLTAAPSKHIFDRIVSVLHDAEIQTLLTNHETADLALAIADSGDRVSRELQSLAVDSLTQNVDFEPLCADPTDIALLQYSSGSTGSPKGVRLSHDSLLHNLAAIEDRFEHTSESRGLSWLPPYHDMGLIGCILQPIYAGFPVALMSPLTFLRAPSRWLKAVSDYRATTSGGPPFAYELCGRHRGASLDGIDLSQWRVAFIGAEAVRDVTLQDFVKDFAPFGFRREAFLPCYGLAESSLIVAGCRVADAPRIAGSADESLAGTHLRERGAVLGCGPAVLHANVVIVDPTAKRRLADGEVGEIWVSSPSVCSGYLNQPEANQALFESLPDTSSRFLRTGDLGFLDHGELFVCGRLKELVIRNGAKHFPPDLEAIVEQHPGVRPGSCVVFSTAFSGPSEAVLLAEAAPGMGAQDMPAVLHTIALSVLERSGLQLDRAHFVARQVLPKTPNGKRMRSQCRALYSNGKIQPVASFMRAGLSEGLVQGEG